MAGKPKPGFWIVVVMVVLSLIGFPRIGRGFFQSVGQVTRPEKPAR